MKTKLLTALCIAAGFAAHAQEFIPSIKIGTNISSVKAENIETSSLTGLDLGFTFTAQLNDNFDLLSEFAYAGKGAQMKGSYLDNSTWPAGNAPVDYKLRIHSFTWSPIGNYYIKAPNFSLQAGPSIGLNIPKRGDANVTFNSSDEAKSFYASQLESEVLGFDFALAAGISGGTEALRANLRYYIGLSNMSPVDNYSLRCNYLQLSLSYSFLNLRMIR